MGPGRACGQFNRLNFLHGGDVVTFVVAFVASFVASLVLLPVAFDLRSHNTDARNTE